MTTHHQFNSTILGHPAFGNVQTCHHFDPCCDCKGQMAWRRNHFIKDALGLDANPELVLKRFKVDVTGVIFDGQQQDHVQKLSHGG